MKNDTHKNGFTTAQEHALIEETKKAEQSGKRYATVDALIRDLES